MSRIQYLRRIIAAYAGVGGSQLTFWHDEPEINSHCPFTEVGEYYMPFFAKAEYRGFRDQHGIPMLDYRGKIGRQYNPIAISQWGLGNYNLLKRTGQDKYRANLLLGADWLCDNLEANVAGVQVWNHYFDWEYRNRLMSPWFSGLAQGQGISLLLRAFKETGLKKYLHTAEQAFESFVRPTDHGGVCFTDANGDIWFEEYIVSPPTHILNGFIWAAWGVFDYFLATGSSAAEALFSRAIATIQRNLHSYDLGFWSLYEHAGTRLPMIASPFYHRLHIAQLRVLHRITAEDLFLQYAERWEGYRRSRSNRTRAVCYKSAFKLCYY